MCCGASYPASSYSGGGVGANTAWSASSGGATDFYAVTPKGETRERVVGSYAEAITATARGGGMRPVSAGEADRIRAANGETG